MIEINGTQCHELLRDQAIPLLAYDKSRNYAEWRQEIRAKFIELTGLDLIAQNACEPDLIIESDEMMEGYRQIRFVFSGEKNELVPCYLLIPDTGKEKYPLAITLQGHSTGFHNSIGVIRYERDEAYQPRGCFGLQAVKRGYMALCIEQRAMGERRVKSPTERKQGCNFQAFNAFMMGRTLIGERVWDVSRAINLMESFPQCDMDKIFITGNSGGGTASYYAACFDERIKVSIPSCSFCSWATSIMAMHHCGCNYIPGAYRQFEMADLACLIAPASWQSLQVKGIRSSLSRALRMPMAWQGISSPPRAVPSTSVLP
ncbi:MAG: acetylxylan esterase [Clostridia bacterium]|nr:acetylxylan esterase [Clostridia bacterium]